MASTRFMDLVSRGDELGWLEFCLEEARAGRPRVVLLSGELGIGKSRLLRTFLMRSRERGVVTGLGRGTEDFSIPYMPFTELLRSTLEGMEASGAPVPPERSPLEPFERAEPEVPGTQDAPAADLLQAGFFREILTRLIALASLRPLLLAIDDFHWLDQASLALVHHVVLAISDASLRRKIPIMFVLATRPSEADTPAARTRARLLREPLCEVLELGGLDLPGTAHLVRALRIARPSSQVVESILDATSGNPLFIEALVRELLERDGIAYESGDAVLRVQLDTLQLSTDVTSAAAARIDAIPSDAREVFEIAALLGQRLEVRVLAFVAGQTEDEVVERIALGEGLVRRDGARLEFSHPLFRHLLGERIAFSRRRRLHALIAERLIALPEPALEGAEWQIVHHLMAAGPEAEVSTLYEHARRAGDRASALYGWREAAEAYRAAAATAPDVASRAPLHDRAAWCFTKNYDYGQSAEAYRAALADYRALGDRLAVARVVADSARSALYHQPLGTLRELDSFHEALASLEEGDVVLRGCLLVRMADAYFYARRPDRGLHCAEEALACAREADDAALREDACLSRGLALHQSLRLVEAEESFREGLGSAERPEALRWEVPLRVRHASVLLMLGRSEEAERQLERALESAARTNDPGEEALAAAYLMVLAASRGHFQAVETHFATVMRLRFRLERRPWAPIVGVPALAYVRLLQGHAAEAEDAIVALAEPGRMIGHVGRPIESLAAIYLALVRTMSDSPRQAGDDDAVRARIARSCERMTGGRGDGTALGVAAALVELASLHGMVGALEGPVSVLTRAAETGALVCTPWPALIPRLLGLAAFLRGEIDRASEHFETALAEGRRLGMRPEVARVQLDYARMLASVGTEAAEILARDLLEPAAATFDALSMEPFRRRAASLGESLGMRLSAPTAMRGAVHDRDLALLRRVATGQDESRVADELLLGEDTVRERLASLYGQLGVEGRLEAVADAVDRGLVDLPREGMSVALLVTDMCGFTPMVERLGDVEAQKRVQHHNRMLRAQVRDFSGVEITHTGDGIIASFRSVAEAIGCAIAIQRRLAEHNATSPDAPLHVGVGVHAGHALPEEGRLFGAAVNAAVRICARCEPDHILASDLVYDRSGSAQSRFRFQGSFALKGISRELPIYEVAWE